MFTRTDDKITSPQASVFLTNSILGAGILTLPRVLTNAAKTADVWLSILIGGCIIIALIVVMVKLSLQFPGKTVFQYSAIVAGRIPALFPCLLLIGYFTVIAGFEIRVLGEVTVFFLLEGTPMWAVLIPFIWVSVYVIMGGINSISRLFQIILPISLMVLLVSYTLSLKLFDIDNLLPVLGDGILPVLQGVKSTVLVFSGIEVIMLLVAHMEQPKQAMKAMLTGVSIPIIIYLITVIVAIGGMSVDAIIRSTWPTIDLLRSFEISGLFFERLEFPFLVIWMMQLFCNLSCYYYSASVGISQLFKLRLRPVILGMIPIIYISAVVPKRLEDLFAVGDFIGWAGLSIFILLPLPLSIIWLIRRKGKKANV